MSDYPLHLRHSLAESAIEVAAALIERASMMKQQCGFASTGVMPGASENPLIGVASSQAEFILDILARIEMSETEDNRELLARALYAVPSGSRFFRVGPPPDKSISARNLDSAPDSIYGITFRQISEYVHEAVI
jgi:hypothetical protein